MAGGGGRSTLRSAYQPSYVKNYSCRNPLVEVVGRHLAIRHAANFRHELLDGNALATTPLADRMVRRPYKLTKRRIGLAMRPHPVLKLHEDHSTYTVWGCTRKKSPQLVILHIMGKAADLSAMTENRIRYWRDKREFTRERLSELIGCSVSHVTKLERGERQLRQHWIEKLAAALHVSPNDLLPNIPTAGNNGYTRLYQAPLISWASAGRPAEVWQSSVEVYVPVLHTRDTVAALKVQGNSMSREATNGSIIVYDYEDKELIDGKLYVVCLDGETTFKRFRQSPPRFEPDSHESGHDTIFPTEAQNVVMVGRVFWIARQV